MNKKDLKKHLNILAIILAVILLFVPITLLIVACINGKAYEPLVNYLATFPWKIVVSIICGLLFIVIVFLIALDHHVYKPIKNEFSYLMYNGRYAWMIGLLISNLLVVLYFVVAPEENEWDMYGTSVSIFIGVLAIILGIHLLYQREAPILGTMNLLHKLYSDLDNYKGGNLIIVFPALNFGFYTEHVLNKKNLLDEDGKRKPTFYDSNSSIVTKVFSKIEEIQKKGDKAYSVKRNVRAIIYTDKDCEQLYMTYHYMISKEYKSIADCKNQDAVKDCVKSCEIINKYFGDNIHKVPPTRLPQPVIVIDDVVFVIADYGMPLYNEKSNSFEPIEKEDKPAELICWRRKDSILAKQIVQHLEKFIMTNKS